MALECINTGDKVPASGFNTTNTIAIHGKQTSDIQGHEVIVLTPIRLLCLQRC